MPRSARIVAVGLPHHITQRGNNRQNIYLNDDDRAKYLSWIQEYSIKYDLSILTYCLMQNHVHFIAIPNREDSLARAFNAAHMRYAQYFNKRTRASGHLWRGRFYSCILDELHLIAAAKYIERNPVRANIVKKPWQWKWSSALAHINNKQYLLKLGNLFEIINMSYKTWREYIDSQEDEKILDKVRRHTVTGRPLGTNAFIGELEKRIGKKLRVLPRGRPRQR